MRGNIPHRVLGVRHSGHHHHFGDTFRRRQPGGFRGIEWYSCDARVAEMESFHHRNRRSAVRFHSHQQCHQCQLPNLHRAVHDDNRLPPYYNDRSHTDRCVFLALLRLCKLVRTALRHALRGGRRRLPPPVHGGVYRNVFVTTSYVETGNTGGRIAAVCATSTCTGSSNGNVTVAIGTVTPSLVLGPTKTSAVACHGTGSSGDGFNLRFDAPI